MKESMRRTKHSDIDVVILELYNILCQKYSLDLDSKNIIPH